MREPRQNNRAQRVCQAIRRLPRIKTDRFFRDPDLDPIVPFEASRDRSHRVLIRVAWIEGVLDLLELFLFERRGVAKVFHGERQHVELKDARRLVQLY